ETFEQFLALCAEAGPESCALAALGDPSEVVEDTLAALKEQPLEVPLPDGSTAELGYDEVVAAVFSSLYAPAGWSDLAALLAEIAVMADPQEQEPQRSEEHTSELQSRENLVCRPLLEKTH